MNLKHNNFYHKFLSFFLLALLFYIFFFWGIGIIYPVKFGSKKKVEVLV